MCPSTVVPETCEPTTNTHGKNIFFGTKHKEGNLRDVVVAAIANVVVVVILVYVCVCFRVLGRVRVRVRVFACGARAVTRRRRRGPRMSFVFEVTFVFVPVVVFVFFVVVVVMGVAVAAVKRRRLCPQQMSNEICEAATYFVRKVLWPNSWPNPGFVNN